MQRFALAVVVLTAAGTDSFPAASAAAAETAGAALQNSEWLIKAWQTEDGLPENSATAMVQTPDGYLWFGTFHGLVRFDGVHLTVFDRNNTPELLSSSIVNLHLDKRGRLWISTYGGLILHEGGRWQVLARDERGKQEYIRTFTERENGDILLTKFNGKIVEFSNGRFTELPPPLEGRPSEYFGCVDELGQWWAVQNKFVGRWDGRAWVPMITVSASADSVGCARAKDGGVWLLAGQELHKYAHGKEVSVVRLLERPGGFWNMAEDSRGNVWICTSDKGLCQVSPDGRMQRWNEDNGLSYHAVRFAYEDTENNIWIGTSGGGLMRFKPRRLQSFGIESGLSERVVRSVWPAQGGGLWIATFGQGLFRLGGTTITNVQIPDWTNNSYDETVLADNTGRIWLGTYHHGLWVSQENGFERILSGKTGGNTVVALFEDARGRIWMSGGREVSVFDSGAFHTYPNEQELSPGGVCCFGEDRDNVIWLSNIRGLFRLEKERFVEVQDKEGRSISGIDCIQSDADGCLWLGSMRDGLIRYRNGSFSRIERDAGLPVTRVNGIVEDQDGFFWLTSNRGLVHVRRKDLESAAEGRGTRLFCQLLDTSDGIPSVEFAGGQQPTCAKDANGRLWFATLKGVAMVDPAKFRINTHPPPVAIEEVVYHINAGPGAEHAKTERRERSPFVERLSLPAGSRNIEIHYTALNFTGPEKVRFQVRLRSRGPRWQEVGNRRVAYFDELRPGENVFEVRAANDDGVWNETGASLGFTLAPLFWQTMWFRASVWVGMVGEGFLILALFHAMARRRRARLELRERLDFEQVLSELSRVFISLPPEKFDAQIMEALRRVGEHLKFDVAAFMTFNGEEKVGKTSVVWRRPGMKEVGCERMAEELPWCVGELKRGQDVWLPRISSLPAEAEKDRATCSRYGLQSSYHVPLYVEEKVVASLSLYSIRECRELSRELLQKQRLIGELFVNALTRKLAEERQRESETRFRIVADSAPVMIWISGVDKLCTFFNKTWLDFTGRALEQELGNGWVEGVHPDDLQVCLHAYNEAFEARKTFVVQYRLRRRDGEYRWILDNGVPRYDTSGDFAGYIGSCLDFTERKQAEEKFRLAIETSPNAILLVSERGLIVMANPKAEGMFGYAAEELVGKSAEMLVPERYRGQQLANRHAFQIPPQNREIGKGRELFARRKDGTEIEVEIALNPIHAQEQMLFLATIVDLTERRRAASEVQHLRQELAHFSRVSIVGQLASALAHELSQPLTAILRNSEAAELFLQSPEPDLEELRNIVVDIRKDDERAGGVIERLRLLLKRRQIEMQMLDAGRLADEVLSLLRSDALGRHVAVELETAPDLPLVYGDRVQLQQVLLNLIMNAMDAVGSGVPEKRRVKVQVGPDGEGFVALSVTDSGQGIPASELDHIFKPFFTTKPGGMGMGLTISRTIVDAHGGRIAAMNNPEGGATFRFTVPVAKYKANSFGDD
jgi:PAS domain S-box-containing protein